MTENTPRIKRTEIEGGVQTSVTLNPRFAFVDTSKLKAKERKSKNLIENGKRLIVDLTQRRVIKEVSLYYINGIQGLKRIPQPTLGSGIPPEICNSEINMLPMRFDYGSGCIFDSLSSKNSNKNECFSDFINEVCVTEFEDGTVYYDTTDICYRLDLTTFEITKRHEKTIRLLINTKDDISYLMHKKSNNEFAPYLPHQTTEDFIKAYFKKHFLLSWLFKKQGDTHEELNVFVELFIKHFLTYEVYDNFVNKQGYVVNDDYLFYRFKIKNSPELKKLPWTTEDLAQLFEPKLFAEFKNRGDMRYISMAELKEYSEKAKEAIKEVEFKVNFDTEGAINACLYNFDYPKPIKEELLKQPPLSFPFISYEMLYEVSQIEGMDNKTLASLLTNKTKDDDGFDSIMNHPYLLNALIVGIDIKTVVSYVDFLKENQHPAKSNEVIRQEMKSLGDLYSHTQRIRKDLGILIKKGKDIGVSKYVEIISDCFYQFAVNMPHENYQVIASTDTSKQIKEQAFGDYKIRSPKTAIEVVEVGNTLGFPVATHAHAYFYKYIDMAIVNDKNDSYVALITFNDGAVKNIKVNQSRVVSQEEFSNSSIGVLDAINKWASHNGYYVSLQPFERPIQLDEDRKDKDRVQYVEDKVMKLIRGESI